MKTLNLRDIPDESWTSPKGAYAGCSKQVSVALGHDSKSGEASNRHPFEVELCRVPAGKKACPFHSHSAQWEYYHVLAGHGLMRHAEGAQPMGPGDVFVFPPGDPHQLTNTGEEDLVVYVVADNPLGESCHYPDSNKWLVRSPSRRIIRSEDIDYYDGEE